MPQITIVVSANGLSFPDEIDYTYDTLNALYEHLSDMGVELVGKIPDMDCSISEKVLGYALCG